MHIIRKYIAPLAVVLSFASAAALGQLFLTRTITDNITGTACPGAGCVFSSTVGDPTTVIKISGTWSGTAAFLCSNDAFATTYAVTGFPQAGGAGVAGPTSAATGTWFVNSSGFVQCGLKASVYTTGPITVQIDSSPSPFPLSLSGVPLGGGIAGVNILDGGVSLTGGAAGVNILDAGPLATSAAQTTAQASLTSIDAKLAAMNGGAAQVAGMIACGTGRTCGTCIQNDISAATKCYSAVGGTITYLDAVKFSASSASTNYVETGYGTNCATLDGGVSAGLLTSKDYMAATTGYPMTPNAFPIPVTANQDVCCVASATSSCELQWHYCSGGTCP